MLVVAGWNKMEGVKENGTGGNVVFNEECSEVETEVIHPITVDENGESDYIVSHYQLTCILRILRILETK